MRGILHGRWLDRDLDWLTGLFTRGIGPRMDLTDLDFHLPDDRIARYPAPERTGARLLGLDRASGQSRDLGTVAGLVDCVQPGDVWVLNDTRVRRARVMLRKASGGRVELLFLTLSPAGADRGAASGDTAVAMYRSAKPLRPGAVLEAERTGQTVAVLENRGDGTVVVALPGDGEAFVAAAGDIPLPPYIDRATEADDAERYQTVYADALGAVAAPTAGLHFTPALMDAMRARGADFVTLTLHVGPGTFKPIKVDRLEDHVMHSELLVLTEAAAARINAARRVVAVGTTTVRSLETAAVAPKTVRPFEGETALFITPGHHFQVVDAMLTNFHLPGSSLLALVGAFAGLDAMKRAYAGAIERGYRFYSYGDAMWIV